MECGSAAAALSPLQRIGWDKTLGVRCGKRDSSRWKTLFRPVNYIALNNLKGFPMGWNSPVCWCSSLSLIYLRSPDRIPWVQALPAMQADFRADTENRGRLHPGAVFPLLSPPVRRRKPGIPGTASQRLPPLAPVHPSLWVGAIHGDQHRPPILHVIRPNAVDGNTARSLTQYQATGIRHIQQGNPR